jgi:hypothetical protein
MTQEDIIRMADKVGFETCRGDGWPDERLLQKLKRFFRLAYECGAAAEREACAKVCEIPAGLDDWEIQCGAEGRQLCNDLASVIRARGNK